MGDDLTLLELARRVGEPPERLREWTSLGLVGRVGRETYDPTDIERIRVIQLMLRRGIELEAVVRANAEEALLEHHVEMAFPDGIGTMFALNAAAAQLGLDVETLRRLCHAAGLLDQGELLSETDLTALAGMKATLDAGFPEEAVVQLARVFLDALGRVAEAESRFTHFYLHDRMRAQGMSGPDLVAAVRSSGEHLLPLIEPMVLYFHRKGWVRALREDVVMHVQERMGLRDDVELPGQVHMTIAFVDLAGFTSLADAMGDHMAAQVIERFSRIVRGSAGRWEGRVVKQIGDAFMLVFHEARAAVACTMAIELQTAAEPQFPATRIGIHSGQVLYREGDYLGSNVNVAARLAAEATRHQILVTAAVRAEASGLSEAWFRPLGMRRLRGLAQDVEVFEVVAAMETAAPVRLIDPVCGMELCEGQEAARLSLEGEERAFCSQQCLQRFVAAPERYGSRSRRG